MTAGVGGSITSRIDQPWPAEDLEPVECCPYCDSAERSLAHRDVQDWSFYGAPGKWSYWACQRCDSLYLSPRPTAATLGRAYGAYYTHHDGRGASLADRLKARVRHEAWSRRLGIDLRPRLHVPAPLGPLLDRLTSGLVEPFELEELAARPAGRLLDVGCGNGRMLAAARQMGWRVTGVEIDPAAIRAARAVGLEVLDGSYTRLAEFDGALDAVICSHVLEHVPDPRDLLDKLACALVPDGLLLLALPNASSRMRAHFGDAWRGLEAPRHLSIPSARQLVSMLGARGFEVRARNSPGSWTATAAESARIQRRGATLTPGDHAAARAVRAGVANATCEDSDFVELVCVKGGDRGR